MGQIYDPAQLGQGIVSGGVHMDDDRWNKRLEALRFMAIEWGVDGDPVGMFTLVKEYWGILDDDALVDGYIAGQRYAQLAQQKINQGGELLTIDQNEADDLAAALGLPPI
jgi:hypothetical protein